MPLLFIALIVFGSVGVAYVVFLVAVAALSVYPPRIPPFFSPAQTGAPQESVWFTTEDGVELSGWWVEGGTNTVLVCLHGFLANKSEFAPYADRLVRLGCSVLFVDFRCHGGSQRSKCTFGTEEAKDVRAAVAYSRQRAPGARIVLMGSSMGGAASVRAMADDPDLADALIADGPYANLDVAARGFWHVTGLRPLATLMSPAASFGRLFLGHNTKDVDLLEHFRKLAGKQVLLLFGDSDKVVPKDSAQNCVDASQSKVEWFSGCGHCQGRFAEPYRYFNSIANFLTDSSLLPNSPDNRPE
ncbi:MAG: alpha/beta fold hydrolase [Chthonomonadaceae bacterium]|nr:alpha/beta fold hydrolase [Chthonomonadaceae bacterium]